MISAPSISQSEQENQAASRTTARVRDLKVSGLSLDERLPLARIVRFVFLEIIWRGAVGSTTASVPRCSLRPRSPRVIFFFPASRRQHLFQFPLSIQTSEGPVLLERGHVFLLLLDLVAFGKILWAWALIRTVYSSLELSAKFRTRINSAFRTQRLRYSTLRPSLLPLLDLHFEGALQPPETDRLRASVSGSPDSLAR